MKFAGSLYKNVIQPKDYARPGLLVQIRLLLGLIMQHLFRLHWRSYLVSATCPSRRLHFHRHEPI